MPSRNLRKTLILTLLLAMLIPAAGEAQSLSPGLDRTVQRLAHSADDSTVEVVVFLDDYELKQAAVKTSRVSALTRAGRIKAVVSELKAYRHPGKERIVNYLTVHSVTPSVIEHWIVPAFTATIPVSRLEELSNLDGVRLVVENARLEYESPVEATPALSTATAAVSDQLNMLNIPEIWSRGLKGKGRLVCSFDTGVEHTHPALDSQWRGNHSSLTSAWFSKVAPDAFPYDLIGHGTHTMGIMVGAAEGDSIGVAPEAEWITAGVVDQGRTLSMTLSDIIEAFQWSLNPDGDDNTTGDVPDVILNSWGIPKGLFSPCDDTFWGIIDYVEAAGIVTIFSAGNEGPEPQTIRSPADRASSPTNAFAIGAVDNSLVIAGFSSRGPSSCDTSQIKPEIVAPGVSIRSSYKDGSYYLMSGTSMAAPYIAGLVALVRQYNPDATVEQIKTAFIQAAEDLGVDGEDNTYGHGFVDAARVFEYIPAPQQNEVEIAGYEISGDGIAYAGETFELKLSLNNSAEGYDAITGTIALETQAEVTVSAATSVFNFSPESAAAVNELSYVISYGPDLYHGQPIDFYLLLSSGTPEPFDTLMFTLNVGLSPRGEIASHVNGELRTSVSDFGQFGFAPGSIYNALGDGFSFDGSENLLYEAGLVVGTDAAKLATSIRDEQGTLKQSDFSPLRSLSNEWTGADGGIHRTALFTDGAGLVSASVEQESVHFDGIDDEGMLIITYTLTNQSLERMSNLCFAFFADFDLSDGDAITIDETANLVYQTNEYDMYVGVVALESIASFQTMSNGEAKTGFTDEQMMQLASSRQSSPDVAAIDDWMFMVSSGPMLIDPRQSSTVAMGLVAGRSLNELYENASKAKSKYEVLRNLADNSDGHEVRDLRLYQNYPNPFNPITNISFSVREAGDVSLEVVNILGQKVTTLYSGYLSAGLHNFEWDATGESGERVASGVYFYRLRGESSSQSRKMLLMK